MIKIRQQQSRKNQSGITMILALLVLGAVTALSFSIAAVTYIELRASGDVLHTEPALYATQGIMEEAIFRIKRGVSGAESYFGTCRANVGDNGQVVTSPVTNIQVKTGLCYISPEADVISKVPATNQASSPKRYKSYASKRRNS